MCLINVKVVLILFLVLSLSSSLYAEEHIGENTSEVSVIQSKSLENTVDSETNVYPFHQFVTLGAIRTYQKLIAPSRGTPCLMHPHCSLYASLCFKEYNPIKAFFMTADRLHRCGHDLGNYETIVVNDFIKLIDPPYPGFVSSDSNVDIGKEPETFRLAASNISVTPDISGESSSDKDLGEDDRLFRFAESLQVAGDYHRAITEYRRLLSYFPNSRYQKEALKAIFHCYYELEKYLLAADWGKNLLRKGILDPIDETDLKFYIGTCYFKLGNFSLARTYLSEAPLPTTEKVLEEKSLLMQGLSYAHEFNWKEAETSFAKVSVNSQFAKNAEQCRKLSQNGQRLRMKKPAVAGVLAIVPGLGYLYDGYKQTALSAFIVNGLFIWGTIEAFRRDNESLGTTLGVLGVGWYGGNIYGSVISAQRKNIKSKNDLLLQFDIGFSF